MHNKLLFYFGSNGQHFSATSTTSTSTTKLSRRRRSVGFNASFEWSAEALIESGAVKSENIAYENMTDPPSTTTTEVPMRERVKWLQDNGIPYFGVCTNESKVITDPKKIYGYYRRTVIVENPVDNVTVENNTWLKHGDMCVLNIKFVGTGPFSYCFINFTDVSKDDENCEEWQKTDVKLINYHRFFPKSSNSYTLVTFIRNEVSMKRHPIGIQFYDGKMRSLKK